jgi:uncharacterized phage infection (PIP) family protein YhgE
MNRLKAIIAALVITTLVACAMLAIGANAMLNPNGVPINDAPISESVSSSTTNNAAASDAASAQINQLQNLVKQYQAREKQYQDREQQYQSQLDQLNAQLQQYQQVLTELQNRGLIRILSNGQIQIRGRTQ